MDENTNTRKKVFQHMPSADKFDYLYDRLAELAATLANYQKRFIDIEEEQGYLQGEFEGISHRKHETLDLNTEEKIDAALNQQFGPLRAYWQNFLKPSLQFIHTALLVALGAGLVWAITQGKWTP